MAKRRKVKKNVLRNFIILLLIIGTGFYIYLNKNNIFNKNITPANNDKPNVIKKPEEIWPKETKVSFLATGDGLIHNTLANNALQKDGTYNFTGYLTEVKDIVQKYDIAYYNQETIFGGEEIGYDTYPTFNTQSEYGDAMLDAGFNTISLASNHSNDKGTVAIKNALKYWNSKEDIMFNGIFKNIEDKNNIMITEKNGIKYALLSYTYGLNGLNLPKGKEYMVNNYNNDANKLKEMASSDIALIKDKVDVIMVAMHWGVEYTFTPTKYQKEQAKVLEELGVDIIIGNHPHTIQPIEWINDTLVIYSLGNFISNQIALKSSIGYKGAIGAFVTLDIKKITNKDQTSEIKLDNLNVELLYTYKEPWADNKAKQSINNFKVIPFSKINNYYLPDYKTVYEEYKNVFQKYDSTINVLPAA